VDLETRVALVKEVGEEIVTEDELRALLASKADPIAYDGFEPSGTAHIAQGVMRAINVNKMTRAGVRFKMFVADWHAWANNKMGGDLERIQVTGKYLIEIWRATGMDLSKVDFVWASEFVEDESYWKKVMNVARDTSVERVLRTTQIMGRSEKDKLSAAQILYPCMQAADIFHLEADITQLGMDQRKVNMLAREVGPKLGFWKPVVVSHHMLMGLQQPPAGEASAEERATAMKMSKSNPDSAIFMTDTPEQVQAKIKKAYCPAKQAEDNPILEYYRYIIFERFPTVKIERPAKFGGDVEYASFEQLKQAFVDGSLGPVDAKAGAAKHINLLLDPVREHFEKNAAARELKQQVESFKVTR
jgi:tyrosyl-tRNA synthetase